jgi:hypothetical protein
VHRAVSIDPRDGCLRASEVDGQDGPHRRITYRQRMAAARAVRACPARLRGLVD